jgi:hypothetical protein
MSMPNAVIVSAVRTAVGKAPNGTLRYTRPDDMAAVVIREALSRASGLDPADVEDVVMGCAMPEAEQGLNVARIASLRAGIPVSASAVTVNRFCSSGIQSIAYAAERIIAGFAEVAIAGGTESMSLVPMGGNKIAPNPTLVDSYPDVYLTTGLVAENHAREAGVSREEQDAFALASHRKAVAAIDGGRFADEIVPLEVTSNGSGSGPQSVTFAVDEGPRRETSLRAGAIRDRSGAGRQKSIEARKPEPRSDRSGRAQRGVRRASDRLPSRAADRSRAPERQRRRHRTRPSPRLHRSEADDNATVRDAPPRITLRPSDDVCRRRHGRGGNFRASVSELERSESVGRAGLN